MKFVIQKEKLIDALLIATKAISGKNPLPILNGIKLDLSSNGLSLTTSDNYISIVTRIPSRDSNGDDLITVFESGSCLIPSKNIIEILRGMLDKEITLETVEENVLKITDSSSDFSLNCMDVTIYPNVALDLEGQSFMLECKKFKEAVNQTAFAAAERDARPLLTGVNLKANGNELNFLATDIFRIAGKTLQIADNLSFNVTIPARTLQDISSIADENENVYITVTEKRVLFKFENTFVIARVINGTYPDVSGAIRNEFKSYLNVQSSNLISAVDRVSKIASDKKDAILLSLSTYKVEVTSRSQESGSAKVNVTFDSYDGESMYLYIDPKHTIDAIRALGCETIEIKFEQADKPMIISNPKDNSCLQLIMPTSTMH